MWEMLLTIGVIVLLCSNLWLLRELDRLQGRIEQHVAEVRLLGDRVYRLSMDVDELQAMQSGRSLTRQG